MNVHQLLSHIQKHSINHFLLPFVNTILDEMVGHELFTFMDGYLGYNQVSLAPKDYHKASLPPHGTRLFM